MKSLRHYGKAPSLPPHSHFITHTQDAEYTSVLIIVPDSTLLTPLDAKMPPTHGPSCLHRFFMFSISPSTEMRRTKSVIYTGRQRQKLHSKKSKYNVRGLKSFQSEKKECRVKVLSVCAQTKGRQEFPYRVLTSARSRAKGKATQARLQRRRKTRRTRRWSSCHRRSCRWRRPWEQARQAPRWWARGVPWTKTR